MVSSDVEYGSLAVTGSGKLTLAGSGRIATSSVTVSSGVALVVNGRLDSTSIAVASGGAVDLVNSRDAHSLSIAGTGINNSGAVYCSESDIVDENNSPFVTNITLAADAMVNADFAWGIIAQNDDKAYLNLGTNKLTIKGTWTLSGKWAELFRAWAGMDTVVVFAYYPERDNMTGHECQFAITGEKHVHRAREQLRTDGLYQMTVKMEEL